MLCALVYKIEKQRNCACFTGRRLYDDETTMVRWWNNDGTMVKQPWHDGETTMVRWHDGETTIVWWWNRDITSRFHHRTIVPSCFHHRAIVVSPSCYRVFIIVPSYHRDFTIVHSCMVKGEKNLSLYIRNTVGLHCCLHIWHSNRSTSYLYECIKENRCYPSNNLHAAYW
jgi:hypothetical protein